MIRPRKITPGIRIAVLRAGRELHVRVRHHRHELCPGGRLERMPGLIAAPRPRRRAKPRAVRHQMADLDVGDAAERIVRQRQLRHVLDDRIVERQQPAIAQLHDRDAGERLRDGRPVIDRGVGRGVFAIEILKAFGVARHDRTVAHDHQAAAGDPGLAKQLPVAFDDPIPSGGRRCTEDEATKHISAAAPAIRRLMVAPYSTASSWTIGLRGGASSER